MTTPPDAAESTSSAPPPHGGDTSGRARLLRKAGTFVLLSAVGLYLGAQQPWREVAPLAPVPAAEAPAVATPVERAALLGDADAATREAVAPASADATWQRWLSVPGILARAIGAVAAVADGESPRALVGFLAPGGEFAVVERDGHTFVAEASFARYDGVARVVASVDARALVRGYRVLSPFIEAAYREIAPPGRRFDATLTRALTRLAFTPVPQGAVRVVPVGAVWGFADARFEARSAAEKHLLRFGPENQRLVQGKLREVQAALAESAPGMHSALE